jgi:TonB family protein
LLITALAFTSEFANAQTIEPDWVAPPSPEAVYAVYPPVALFLRLPGKATVTCFVDLDGQPNRCRVKDASPAALGFGEAALSLAKTFRMRPQRVGGVPTEQGRVTVPINFDLPTPEPMINKPPVPTVGQGMIAARRLAKAQDLPEQAKVQIRQGYQDQLRMLSAPDAGPVVRREMFEAYDKSIDRNQEQLIEQFAAVFARSDSVDDLRELASFFESRSGQGYVATTLTRFRDGAALLITDEMIADARTQFYARRDCAVVLSSAPLPRQP